MPEGHFHFHNPQGSSRSIKDDEAYYENHNAMNLQLSSTHSKLYLDCLSESDEAKYTCVAENAMMRKSQTTFLRVGEYIISFASSIGIVFPHSVWSFPFK